jgi:hypothetical protein
MNNPLPYRAIDVDEDINQGARKPVDLTKAPVHSKELRCI